MNEEIIGIEVSGEVYPIKNTINDTTISTDKTWSSEKINNSLENIGGRKKAVVFPFTPTENGVLIITISQKSPNPVIRAVNVRENESSFFYINHSFGSSWGASSTSIPLIKGKTYTVEDPENVIMYEKTTFTY